MDKFLTKNLRRFEKLILNLMRNGFGTCFFLLLSIFACQKENFKADGDISMQFSMDTVSFDTIFSNIRTVTKRLMVFNPYNESIKFHSIRLAMSELSPFVLNIDGETGKAFENITIRPKDSLYVFIQSFYPERGLDVPLYVKDSILFDVNQTVQDVKVIAYSQDVHVLNNVVIKTQTWSGIKPYLIMGTLTVDSLELLTINEGVVVYMHRGANILVKGEIAATGTFDKPVIFQGERLDKDYRDIPGQWGGIYINSGNTSHKFIWSIIRNGTTGIQIGNAQQISELTPELELKNTIIQNMTYGCLLAYHAKIDAGNCLIANAKSNTCYLSGGGQYQFNHTTIANYYSIYDTRDFYKPTLYLSNFETDVAGTPKMFDLTNTFFRNSIIYGTSVNELELSSKQDKVFDATFDFCLVRGTSQAAYSPNFANVIWNKDPKFKDYESLNFALDTLSNAKDKGDLTWSGFFPTDLKNHSRLADGKPDIGAYERIETK
jgi:hypothetical protein